jgi:hypothetical protein
MQINSTTAGALQTLVSVQAATAPPAVTTAQAASSMGATPLFTNGLANYASLMTPAMLSSLFALNADGTVKTDSQGTPQMAATHKGPYNAAEGILADHVRAQSISKLGIDPSLGSAITDQQKQFFHDTTGYNLVSEAGSVDVVDDNGKIVSNGVDPKTGGVENAVWQLADSLVVNQMPIGQHATVDAAWFQKFTADMASGGIAVPASWAANAQKHFDGVLNAMMDSQSKSATDPAKASVDITA